MHDHPSLRDGPAASASGRPGCGVERVCFSAEVDVAARTRRVATGRSPEDEARLAACRRAQPNHGLAPDGGTGLIQSALDHVRLRPDFPGDVRCVCLGCGAAATFSGCPQPGRGRALSLIRIAAAPRANSSVPGRLRDVDRFGRVRELQPMSAVVVGVCTHHRRRTSSRHRAGSGLVAHVT